MLRMEIYRTIAPKNSLNEKVKGHILGTFYYCAKNLLDTYREP